MGQFSLADAYFERALGMNPDFIPVFKERARAKLQSGDLNDAGRYFRIYQSRVDQLDADALLLGWRLSKAEGQTQAAFEYEAQLRANYPYSDELHSISSGSTE